MDGKLDDRALERGAAAPEFARIVDDFAWAHRCFECPHNNIFSKRGMCMEVYNELLANFSRNEPIGERCPRRD